MISSDERLKTLGHSFDRGIDDLRGITPVTYQWNEQSGFDMTSNYIGFSAQNVQQFIPEAVGVDSRGMLTLSDRPIMAAIINATKEQQTVFDVLLGIGTTTATNTASTSLFAQAASDSLWSKIVTFFEGFVDGVLTLAGLRTEELCVGTVCVDEDTFLKMVEGVEGTDAAPASNGGEPANVSPEQSPASGGVVPEADQGPESSAEPKSDAEYIPNPELTTEELAVEQDLGEEASSATMPEPNPESVPFGEPGDTYISTNSDELDTPVTPKGEGEQVESSTTAETETETATAAVTTEANTMTEETTASADLDTEAAESATETKPKTVVEAESEPADIVGESVVEAETDEAPEPEVPLEPSAEVSEAAAKTVDNDNSSA
jgi:hypothetical protein